MSAEQAIVDAADAARAGAADAHDPLEHAMRSQALTRVAAGIAHDVKNPLNAMALQVAILADKLADAGDGVATLAASHLAAIREQIGRVNDVVRRFADAVDPSAAHGFTDVGGLLSDVARLFAHEARRRQVAITCHPPHDAVHARSDAARTGRVLLGLLWKCIAETPPAGRVAASASASGAEVAIRLEHEPLAPSAELAFVDAAAASAAQAMGGRLSVEVVDGVARYVLELPRDDA